MLPPKYDSSELLKAQEMPYSLRHLQCPCFRTHKLCFYFIATNCLQGIYTPLLAGIVFRSNSRTRRCNLILATNNFTGFKRFHYELTCVTPPQSSMSGARRWGSNVLNADPSRNQSSHFRRGTHTATESHRQWLHPHMQYIRMMQRSLHFHCVCNASEL